MTQSNTALQQSFYFANTVLTIINPDGYYIGCIWSVLREKISRAAPIQFTDETHFHLNGFRKKQNCRFQRNENLYLSNDETTAFFIMTAWAAINSKVILNFFSSQARLVLRVTALFLYNLLPYSKHWRNEVKLFSGSEK